MPRLASEDRERLRLTVQAGGSDARHFVGRGLWNVTRLPSPTTPISGTTRAGLGRGGRGMTFETFMRARLFQG